MTIEQERHIRNIYKGLYGCEIEGDIEPVVKLFEYEMEDNGITDKTIEQYIFWREFPNAVEYWKRVSALKRELEEGD